MKETIKKLFQKNIFKFVIMPLILLTLWVGLTCLYIVAFDTSLSVISYIQGKDSFNKISYNKLLKGDKLAGEFKAAENNLGIVSVKFQTFIRPPYSNEDFLIFRLREKGSRKWYYENKYRDGLIYDMPIFPFGFPKIINSQGKTYQFEIQSINGSQDNSVALSDRGQILFSKYQVSKSLLLHDKKEFGIFIIKKFISAMITTDVRFSSFIYLFPLIFYLFWISPFGEQITNPLIKKILKPFIPVLRFIENFLAPNLHWIILTVVLMDIFIVQLANDMVYFVIIGLWIAALRVYKMDSRWSFVLALTLLLIPPIFLFFKDSPTAEKGTIWAFMFLVAGTIQALLELKSGRKANEKN
jgi:hypothetical protein